MRQSKFCVCADLAGTFEFPLLFVTVPILYTKQLNSFMYALNGKLMKVVAFFGNMVVFLI